MGSLQWSAGGSDDAVASHSYFIRCNKYDMKLCTDRSNKIIIIEEDVADDQLFYLNEYNLIHFV